VVGEGIQVNAFLAGLDSLNGGSFDQAANAHCNTIGQSEYAPADTRDDALLAVSSDDAQNGKHYIHIYDFARGTSTRVSDGGTEVFPVLSPDGKRVAYEVNNGRTSQYIDVAATDDSGKLERLAASDFLIPNDWSANGRFLVYMNFQKGESELDSLDLSNHSQAIYGPGAEAQFSPDGKWIAFTGPESSVAGEGLKCM